MYPVSLEQRFFYNGYIIIVEPKYYKNILSISKLEKFTI